MSVKDKNVRNRRRAKCPAAAPDCCSRVIPGLVFYRMLSLSYVAGLISVDHLLDHLSADRACLAGGEVAVVTVLKINSYFISSFDLELFKSLSALIAGNTFHYKTLLYIMIIQTVLLIILFNTVCSNIVKHAAFLRLK